LRRERGRQGGAATRRRVDIATAQHAVRQFFHDVEVFERPCLCVPFLDQEPGLVLPALAAHAHQRPVAAQLVAAQFELQLALGQPPARVALGHPLAAVPDDHRARTVLPGRDGAFEVGIRDRMVFDVHRHALHAGIEARALGHSPALERAVEFEPEVVMQLARMVLLHHEGMSATAGPGDLARIRRLPEIALAVVGRQRLARTCLACHVLPQAALRCVAA
jgi:hypothetical protein